MLPHEVLNPLKAAEHYTAKLYQPAAELVAFMEHYWIVRWDLRNQSAFTVEAIPAPYINMTFMKEGPRITGVTTDKYTYELKEMGMIVGIKFRPGGFYPFWQEDVSQLTNNEIPASRVFNDANELLNARILRMKTDKTIIRRLNTLLLGHRPKDDSNVQVINDIIESLSATDAPSVRSLAQKFGMGERTLQELFHSYVGVGVKWIILRSRLQQAAKLAAQVKSPDWRSIALELGYSDQSHFINDFKRIIGKSPAQYAAMVRMGSI